MSAERWRPIPGYESAYEVSDQGRVRSLERYVCCGKNGSGKRLIKGRILRPGPSPSGHLTVALGKGNSKGVHTLVLRAFIGPPPPKHEALHRDGNPAHNILSNLRYGTRSENNFDITKHKRRQMSDEQIRYVRQRAQEGFAYGELYQLALAWGVNPGNLWHVKTGRNYSRVS